MIIAFGSAILTLAYHSLGEIYADWSRPGAFNRSSGANAVPEMINFTIVATSFVYSTESIFTAVMASLIGFGIEKASEVRASGFSSRVAAVTFQIRELGASNSTDI